MATNTKVTLKRLIAEFKDWSDNHQMIKRFGYGDFLELMKDSENDYPYFMMNCSNAGSSKWYIKFTLEICVMDWVYDNRGNQNNIESDTLEIVRDLQNTIEESPRWNDFSKLVGDIAHRKFIERGDDKTAGWCGTMVLWVRKTSGFCNLEAIMPLYDFESQSIAIPPCDPAEVTVNTIPFTTIASGATGDIPVKDTGDNFVGFKDGTIWRVPEGVTVVDTASIYKTGQTESFNTGDDGDLKFGGGVDFFTLEFNNPNGNANRFTDDAGGQAYTSGVIVDWSTFNQAAKTVTAFFKTPETSATLPAHLSGQPFTKNSLSNWFVINVQMLNNICNWGVFRNYLNYSPFDHDISSSTERIWSSTYDSVNRALLLVNGPPIIQFATTPARTILFRTYTLTELGL